MLLLAVNNAEINPANKSNTIIAMSILFMLFESFSFKDLVAFLNKNKEIPYY